MKEVENFPGMDIVTTDQEEIDQLREEFTVQQIKHTAIFTQLELLLQANIHKVPQIQD